MQALFDTKNKLHILTFKTAGHDNNTQGDGESISKATAAVSTK